jgi:hypothetical protein
VAAKQEAKCQLAAQGFESLPSAPSLHRSLCCHVRSQALVAWECALAPYPAADNVSARRRRRGSGPAEHLIHVITLCVALFPCAPPYDALAVSCSASSTPSFVSSRGTFFTVTLCLGTPSRCIGCVLVFTVRFASPGLHLILLGGVPLWNAAGAASSISSSTARLPRLRARMLLICGLISWISCLLPLSRPRKCARRCMLTLLTLRMSAVFSCRGS